MDGEDVVQVAIVTIGPKLGSGPSIGKRHCNSHSISSALHTALQDVGDPELSADLTKITRFTTPETLDAGLVDYLEGRNLGQSGEDGAVHAVSEKRVFLLGA